MDQQQNGQRQKGPQQNGPRKSGSAIKSCPVRDGSSSLARMERLTENVFSLTLTSTLIRILTLKHKILFGKNVIFRTSVQILLRVRHVMSTFLRDQTTWAFFIIYTGCTPSLPRNILKECEKMQNIVFLNENLVLS